MCIVICLAVSLYDSIEHRSKKKVYIVKTVEMVRETHINSHIANTEQVNISKLANSDEHTEGTSRDAGHVYLHLLRDETVLAYLRPKVPL